MELFYLSLRYSNRKTIVDKETYEQYKSVALKENVAGYTVLVSTNEFLHRIIMGLTNKSPIFVDHKDGNPLNNVPSNLRLAYQSQNAANQKKRKGCKSKYKGIWVQELKTKTNYNVEITLNYKKYRLGSYTNEFKAAIVYDKAALFFFGKFARLNFPDKIHLHKKLCVRYVDYDSDLVEFITEEELKRRAEQYLIKKERNKRYRRIQREESFKDNIKQVTNKKLGKVLKIKLNGVNDGRYFYANIDDYDALKDYRFYVFDNVITGVSIEDKRRSIYDILGISVLEVVHKDGNTFNCTRQNITGIEIDNIHSKKVKAFLSKKDKTSSKYIGVRLTPDGTYRVGITDNNSKTISLGCYSNEEFAAKVYDCAARRKFGKGAILNFPDYENENIKLPGDPGYVRIPQLQKKGKRGSKYIGVIKDKNHFIAKIVGVKLGRFDSEEAAALAFAYASVKTGLYRIDLRFLNFSKKEYKKLIADDSLLSNEQKRIIRQAVKDIKWAQTTTAQKLLSK